MAAKSPSLTIVKLLDGTKLFARQVKNAKRQKILYVENVRYMKGDESPRYLNDVKIGISYDAIEVFFMIHKGDKKPEPKQTKGPHYSGPKGSA